ncbi:enoyl-CoA hydratase-related protein [Vineibacter terrae]|uniref:Enoyl-CoA hydratase n=1 Tax=Vineibacter terrae TaxID=2586908 RepID=A0A5C8PNS0_9HYPH|nr:enoyl-CoA hydratase-related protein [Vineibacter terrae]TXL76422.1 enoyl-CoA hydratase [Vineibacter terrae]HEX2891978.1 enoyl-CoA hydratase-related protein [Vineibacter terrae]
MTTTADTLRLWRSEGTAALPPQPLACIRDGAIAHVVINRPAKRNALTAQIWEALPATLRQLGEDPAIRLVVLRGAGTAAFSGGADIEEFPTVFGDAEATRRYNAAVREAQLAVEMLAKPTLAVVHGACVGGGCGLALACDLRFAAADARFGITPSKLGAAYSVPDTRRLVALVGPSRAKDILFSGRLLSAAEAAQWALVDRVFPPSALEAEAAAYAALLLANAHQSLVIAKATINAIAGLCPRPEAELDDLFEGSFQSRDFKEGYAAFMEKRRPRFE